MSIQFNADEVFEMAVEIERNGAKFYRKAAAGVPEEKARRELLDLAAMEDSHERVFAAMREGLSATDRKVMTADPQNEEALYLEAMVDGKVFARDADPSAQLTGKESLAEILRTAIGLEKDSIVFYVGMEEAVPERMGKEKIGRIIKEEMRHVTQLSSRLAALG